jgi:hypothetical protein
MFRDKKEKEKKQPKKEIKIMHESVEKNCYAKAT